MQKVFGVISAVVYAKTALQGRSGAILVATVREGAKIA
jgi:hypothetical protein